MNPSYPSWRVALCDWRSDYNRPCKATQTRVNCLDFIVNIVKAIKGQKEEEQSQDLMGRKEEHKDLDFHHSRDEMTMN